VTPNLPPVTDEEHVSLVLVDPGVLDHKQIVSMLEMFADLSRAEARALVEQAPVAVIEDVPLVEVESLLPLLMIGTSSWGITDAAAAPSARREVSSPPPSLMPTET
jgi:hypothetical protein